MQQSESLGVGTPYFRVVTRTQYVLHALFAHSHHSCGWFTASLDRNHCLIILRAKVEAGISAFSAAASIRFLSSSVRRTFIQFGYLLGISVSRCNFQNLAKHGTRLNKTILCQRRSGR